MDRAPGLNAADSLSGHFHGTLPQRCWNTTLTYGINRTQSECVCGAGVAQVYLPNWHVATKIIIKNVIQCNFLFIAPKQWNCLEALYGAQPYKLYYHKRKKHYTVTCAQNVLPIHDIQCIYVDLRKWVSAIPTLGYMRRHSQDAFLCCVWVGTSNLHRPT